MWAREFGMNTMNFDISKFLANGLSSDILKKVRNKIEAKCSDTILLTMFEEGLHADIMLKPKGGSMQAHCNVLANVSPVFYTMFKHNC